MGSGATARVKVVGVCGIRVGGSRKLTCGDGNNVCVGGGGGGEEGGGGGGGGGGAGGGGCATPASYTPHRHRRYFYG